MQLTHPNPANTPCNQLFVPESTRFDMLQLGHSSQLMHQPVLARTLQFLLQQFCWPSMSQNAKSIVAACVCARGELSTHLMTGLPHSAGNTTILSVGDHFSKAVHVFLSQSSPLLQKLKISSVSMFFFLPPQAPYSSQFSSQVWKTFCSVLGATLNLSTG